MTDNGHPIGGLAMQAGGVPTFMKLIKKLTTDIKKAEKAGDTASALAKRNELNEAIRFGVNDPLMPRAQPLTQAELRMYAERMAPQVAGEMTREAKGAKTVAGKAQKQFKREQTLPVERSVLPGAVDPSAPLPIMTLEDQTGSVLLGLPGDPTLARVNLSGIGDVPFERPVTLHGGPRYGDEEKLWASNLGAATGLLSAADRASRQYGNAPVIASYMKMPSGLGFAQHYLESLLQYQRPDQLTKKAQQALTKDIKEGFINPQGKRVTFPDFPGFGDMDAVLDMALTDTNLRKHLADRLEKSEKYGLRPAADVQFAVSHPELTNLETGASGFTLGELRPAPLTESAHPTYSHDIPGRVLGQTQYPTPYDLLYRDQLEMIRQNPKAPEFNTLKLMGARQKIDEQLVNEINEYQERMRQLLGRKKGGAVKKAEGGSLTDLPDEVNPSNWREHLQNNVRADARALLGAKDGGVINLDELIEKSLKKKDGGVINLDDLIAWTMAKDEHRKMKEGGAVKMQGGGNPGEVAGDMFKPKPLSIPEPITSLVEALRRQFEKEKRSMSKPGAAQDVLMRGPVAAYAGAPADILGMGGELLDYAQKKIPALRKPASVMDTGPEKVPPMGYAPVFPLSPEGSYGTTAAQEMMGKAGLTTGEERPLFETGAMVGAPVAGYAGLKAGKALAPTAKEMLDVQLQQMMSPYQMNVIKPEGGNWVQGSVENYLKGLKYHDEVDPIGIMSDADKAAEQAIINAQNNFVDKKLTRYVQNQMGTPSDPVRIQADAWQQNQKTLLADKQKQIDKVRADIAKAQRERNVDPEVLTRSQARLRELQKEQDFIKNRKGLHFEPGGGGQVAQEARSRRLLFNSPQGRMAESEIGKNWEDMSDLGIMQKSYMDQPQIGIAKTYAELKNAAEGTNIVDKATLDAVNRELEKMGGKFALENPEALAYGMSGRADYLGFSHLMDELDNALRPSQGLPEYLQLTPKTLDKMSMQQAVEHVDKINAWRASQKAEVDKARAANAATVVHKEYPEQGLKWVELKVPEMLEDFKVPDQYEIRKPTPSSETFAIWDKNKQGYITTGLGTEEAAMKHLHKTLNEKALEDALKYEGEILQHCVGGYCPDVVEGRSRIFSLRDEEGRPHATIEVQPSDDYDLQKAINWKTYLELQEKDPDAAVKYAAEIRAGLPNKIKQIKGAQNRKPEAEFMPYIQDFVRSGDWSAVGDIGHTDLTPVEALRAAGWDVNKVNQKYLTKEEIEALKSQSGMKRGGRITKADLEREYRMAFGGGVFNTDPDITDAGRIIPEHTI